MSRPTRRPIALAFVVPALAFATGCVRTVLVPESAPMRIGPRTRATVYVREGAAWTLSANRVDLPEGWYLVPPSFVEDAD